MQNWCFNQVINLNSKCNQQKYIAVSVKWSSQLNLCSIIGPCSVPLPHFSVEVEAAGWLLFLCTNVEYASHLCDKNCIYCSAIAGTLIVNWDVTPLNLCPVLDSKMHCIKNILWQLIKKKEQFCKHRKPPPTPPHPLPSISYVGSLLIHLCVEQLNCNNLWVTFWLYAVL